jgi:hypothetical protein
MAMLGWSRRSRRGSPAEADAAFASAASGECASTCAGNARRATRRYGARTRTRTARLLRLCKMAEQAGAELETMAR